jgi:hypothetical protein
MLSEILLKSFPVKETRISKTPEITKSTYGTSDLYRAPRVSGSDADFWRASAAASYCFGCDVLQLQPHALGSAMRNVRFPGQSGLGLLQRIWQLLTQSRHGLCIAKKVNF